MLLPQIETQIEFECTGETTSKRYSGSFTVKSVLNNFEATEVALRTDRYNGGSQTIPVQIALFNRAVAELELRVKSSPEWWSKSDSGRLIFDQNVVFELFNKVLEAQKEWKDRLNQEAVKSESASKSKKNKKESDQEGQG
jgi:hypothetical protein